MPGALKLKMVVMKFNEERSEEIMMIAMLKSQMVCPSWEISDKGE